MKVLTLYFVMLATVGALFLFECNTPAKKPFYIHLSTSARNACRANRDTILMQWREDTEELYTSVDTQFTEPPITRFIVLDSVPCWAWSIGGDSVSTILLSN
jgi:hypothetical protein